MNQQISTNVELSELQAGARLKPIIRLRWGMVLAFAASAALVFAASPGFVDVTPLILAIAVPTAGNIILSICDKKSLFFSSWAIGSILLLDIVSLTVLLHFSGGPLNPFSIIYLFPVIVSITALSASWTTALAGLSVFSFALLFKLTEAEHAMHHAHNSDVAEHLYGMLIAFSITTVFLCYFVWTLRKTIEQRERSLLRMKELSLHQERLASLTTLAAGAAHELSTPLGTIAIAAKELERNIQLTADKKRLTRDTSLIRDEVRRCRNILDAMGTRESKDDFFNPEFVPISSIVDFFGKERTRRGETYSLKWRTEIDTLFISRSLVEKILEPIIDNALDASSVDTPVTIEIDTDDDTYIFRVIDSGIGMSDSVRARSLEPFFSTKDTGQGMGLGLFIVRLLVERFKGTLSFDSTPSKGTTVSIELPIVSQDFGLAANG